MLNRWDGSYIGEESKEGEASTYRPQEGSTEGAGKKSSPDEATGRKDNLEGIHGRSIHIEVPIGEVSSG